MLWQHLNVSSLLYSNTLVALWPYWWQPHECFHLFRQSYCKCGTWLRAWRRNIKKSLIWAQERHQSCGFAPTWLAAPVSWMTQSSPLTGNSSPGSFLLIKAHRRDARRLTCKWLLSPEPSAASAKWRNNTRQQCGSVLLAALRCVWTSRYILPTVQEKPEKGSVSDSPLYRRSIPPPDSLFAVQKQMVHVCVWMCKHRTFPYNPSPSSVWPALWAGFFLLM